MEDSEKKLSEQHVAILKKLDNMEKKVARAEGAFWATGALGFVFVALIAVIYTNSTNSIKSNTKIISGIVQDLAVIRTKQDDFKAWRISVDAKLEKVDYK